MPGLIVPMAYRRPILAEDFARLLDYVQRGDLFALQDYLKCGNPIRPPEDPQSATNLLRTAVTTGFYTVVAELLRAGGWNSSELAAAQDLARSRNRDDIADLILLHTTQSPGEALPTRARNCLTAAGIPLDRQAVLHALRTGALSWRTPCYGRYTHRDVCLWLGVDPLFAMPDDPAAERVSSPDNGLSDRANAILRRAGIPAEQLPVKQALETGALFPGKRPYTYGKQTHAELCRWVGLDVATLRRQVYLLGVAERRRAQKPSTKPSTISSTTE
jgi:hypothetical protein